MSDKSQAFTRDRRTHFPSLLRQIGDKPPRLPLLCTVNGTRLRHLIEEDRLSPEMPTTAGDPMVMVYYGKSVLHAYSGQIDPSRNYFAPVVMVLDESLLDEAAHVYPFDTGSWTLGGLAPEAWQDWPLEEFDIRAVRDGPSRVVQAFYGNNYGYLTNAPSPDRSLSRRKLVPIGTYAQWLETIDPLDDPLPSAIEVQLAKPVVLSNHLKAIVAPTLFLTDRIVAEFLIAFDVRVYAYSFYGGRMARYSSLIDELVLEHMRTLGVVHHG